MSDYPPPVQATPATTLREQIMNPNFAKNEREWWAAREIERLERDNAALQARIATIPDDVWSRADLVAMNHQTLAERDDLAAANVALCDDLAKIGTLLGVETGDRDSGTVLAAASRLSENGNYAYALEMVEAANRKRTQVETENTALRAEVMKLQACLEQNRQELRDAARALRAADDALRDIGERVEHAGTDRRCREQVGQLCKQHLKDRAALADKGGVK